MEFDLKWGTKDCLTSLKDTAVMEDRFYPGSVKRVGDIFEKPEFYKGGATAGDIRQGRDGDCWLMAALGTLGNKPGLIEKVCVARDEQIGVYGFVFHRDGEWISEIIDDKLYLTKPDYDESWIERNLIEDRQRINSEEDYRKIYQVCTAFISVQRLLTHNRLVLVHCILLNAKIRTRLGSHYWKKLMRKHMG